MKKLKPILFVSGASLFFLGGHAGRPQQEQARNVDVDFCATRNTTFQDGEVLTYNVYYSIIGIYVQAANATINVNAERLNNKPVYHITATGKTTSSLEWIS
ncbi:MAG: DUF3108 domain-containing protein, partial [Chitinophagaceae bacterium]